MIDHLESCTETFPDNHWQLIVESQHQRLEDAALLKELEMVAQQVADPVSGREAFFVNHPNDPETIFIEYDREDRISGRGRDTLVFQKTGNQWLYMNGPRVGGVFAPVNEISLIGFTEECGMWSLYAFSRNIEYQTGDPYPTIYKSRNYGQTWDRISDLGHNFYSSNYDLPQPLPENVGLVNHFYDEEGIRETFFAYNFEKGLYALSYIKTSVISTPEP